MKGTLFIRPLSAALQYDTRTILSMSPFCIFTMDGQTGTTRPCKNGGKQPTWPGQTIELQKRETGFRSFVLTIEMLDEQLWSDEVIGTLEVMVDRELEMGRKMANIVNVRVMRKGNHIGEMRLELEWDPVPMSMKSMPDPGKRKERVDGGRGSLPGEGRELPPVRAPNHLKNEW